MMKSVLLYQKSLKVKNISLKIVERVIQRYKSKKIDLYQLK